MVNTLTLSSILMTIRKEYDEPISEPSFLLSNISL